MIATATVVVRHSPNCPDKDRGPDWRKCNCRKGIRTYEGGGPGSNRYRSAHTRSWQKAEEFRQQWLDQFDPVKQELKQLKAVKEAKQVTVESAVVSFIKDMLFRLGQSSTVKQAMTMFAFVDGDKVRRNGKFLDWLDQQVPRPEFIGDITPAHLMAWRSSWTCGDLTAYIRWTTVKGFFSFCVSQGWLEDSPARNLKRPKYKKGNRTAIFTDEQYNAILEAAKGNQTLETFLELMRWSGVAIVDAVEFRQESVDGEGVLKYRRVKTKTLATVPLPEHVIALLRLAGPGQPFRHKELALESDIMAWRKELQALFTAAGVTKVKTDVGLRNAHPHQLRDTFAVWSLRHGARIHTVSRMLGHSSVKITEQSYLPWVTELEQAHIDDARKLLEHAKPKQTSRRVVNFSKK